MFCLVVLIWIIGTDLVLVMATHLFTIMHRDRLWCSACSNRHVTFDGILFLCPDTVMTELLGRQTGCFFDLTVICPIYLVYHQFSVGLFLDMSSVFWGSICSDCLKTVWVDTPNTLPSLVPEWW